MKTIIVLTFLFLSPITCLSQGSDSLLVRTAIASFQDALRARQAKDVKTFLTSIMRVQNLLPDHPGIVYNLAQAYALNNEDDKALIWLGRLVEMRTYYNFKADTVFRKLGSLQSFQTLVKRSDDMIKPKVTSLKDFYLEEKDLANESIAFDEKTGVFYISSIHKRKIIKRMRDGSVSDFSHPLDSLLGVYGMRVDPERNWLWACNVAVPQMQGYSPALQEKSFLCAYDLATGKMVRKIYLPPGASQSQIKDVTVDKRGDIYLTNMGENSVYKIDHATMAPELLIEPGYFGDPLGIDVSTDGKYLFIADYWRGVVRYEFSTRKKMLLSYPKSITLQGIDGLYFHKNSLIAIQNGVKPARVVRCRLSSDQSRIVSVDDLDFSSPLYDWPTLGVITNGGFLYYIANSQWNNFSNKGTVLDPSKLTRPQILKLKL